MSFDKLPLDIQNQIRGLQKSSRMLRQLNSSIKNHILLEIARALITYQTEILAANKSDLDNLPPSATSAFRDRLLLNELRLLNMAESLKQVAALPDPVGEIVDVRVLENDLKLSRARTPLGFIFMIFESRPNVITEAFSLAFKSGNVILLRGGSESKSTAQVIYKIINDVMLSNNLSPSPASGVEDYDRGIVENLLKCKDFIDVVVPRGGDSLISFVQTNSLIPIIKNDRGLCHTYVDEFADLDMATNIVTNAKTQRPGVCNALETVLVHEKIAEKFLPLLYQATQNFNLKWHVDKKSQEILPPSNLISLATEQDWDTEYLDLIINCKIMSSLEQALDHIAIHGTKHSEAIVTRNKANAQKFLAEVDAAATYWNASTRFTDGFEFGLGGELGISTQKLHVRGPVGLKELTSLRWLIEGQGQIRR